MEVGIVGLTTVGKSTIFNVLTKAGLAAVANYPFCTIDPNVGVVNVPDKRLDFLFSVYNDGKTTYVPAIMKFVDIAGLVKGASKGEGLGNKFLSTIREVDAIAHIVRVFTDPNIIHVSSKVEPINDIETINTELMLSDLEVVGKTIHTLEKKAKSGDKESQKRMGMLLKVKTTLEEGKWINVELYDEEERKYIKEYAFMASKPVLYVFNADETGLKDFETTHADLVKYVLERGSRYVVISAKIEAEMIDLTPEDKAEFIKELGIEYVGLEEFIKESYKLLDLITFLTAGPQEVRAWPIKRGTSAEKAAGKIHSDIERGFIRAEIMKFTDFEKIKDEVKMKEKGLTHSQGRDYIMEDGDITYFKFAV